MNYVRMVALILIGAAVSGCSALDTASRNAPFEAPAATAVTPAVRVEAYQVRVPNTLKVSEANSYYPISDIVWRGEPLGDRHKQVRTIFEESLALGTNGADKGVPVLLDIEVTRFHSLTEKTRYTVGGMHSLFFTMNFLDPETLKPVAEPRKIDASFKAFGGARAITAERNGNTQRVRISRHLAGVFQRELGVPAKVEGAQVQPQPQPIPVDHDVVSQNAQSSLLSDDKTSGLY